MEQYKREKDTELDMQKKNLESKFVIEKQKIQESLETKLAHQKNELKKSNKMQNTNTSRV